MPLSIEYAICFCIISAGVYILAKAYEAYASGKAWKTTEHE